MSALLRIYDNVTSNKHVSLGITGASTTYSLYVSFTHRNITQPAYFLIHACAGVALAYLGKAYLVHNNEVKNKGERNVIYSTLLLVTGFTYSLKTSFIANRIHSFISNSYAIFNLYPSPMSVFPAAVVGFSIAMSYYQVKDYRSNKL